MNAIRPPFASPRMNRMLFRAVAVLLAAGTLTLVVAFVGRGDHTTTAPDKGFNAQLPEKTHVLRTAAGRQIHQYAQLQPEVKRAVRHFLMSAVTGKNFADSWKYIAPQMRAGYTYSQWASANSHPIVVYPLRSFRSTSFNVVQANNEEILIEVGLMPRAKAHIHPAIFLLGVAPVVEHGTTHWLVDYWGPRWTPFVPYN